MDGPTRKNFAADDLQETLADTAYRRIEDMIVTRELTPGSMISENQLSEELRCGRTPIREALQRLKLEGFVEIHPRRGALVTPIDVMTQLELLEVRRPLEELIARLAAERASASERAEMLGLAKAIKAAAAAADRSGYLAANRQIHEIRSRAANNTVLVKSSGMIFGLSRRFWYAYIADTGSFEQAADLHSAILEAIVARDKERCSVSVADLNDFLESLTRRAIERRI